MAADNNVNIEGIKTIAERIALSTTQGVTISLYRERMYLFVADGLERHTNQVKVTGAFTRIEPTEFQVV